MSDTERMANALERIATVLERKYGVDQGLAPQAPTPAPVAAAALAQAAGTCPIHATPWRTTKKDGSPSKRAYCSGKMEDGSYCNQQGPWLG